MGRGGAVRIDAHSIKYSHSLISVGGTRET